MKSPKKVPNWRIAVAVTTLGALHAASCSSDDLRAVVIGLSAAANAIEGQDRDISFSDWLASELQD